MKVSKEFFLIVFIGKRGERRKRGKKYCAIFNSA
jgi:hypothetical protein